MKNVTYSSRQFLRRYAPNILSYAGAFGVIATSIMTIKATSKAIQILDKASIDKEKKLSKIDVFKYAGPIYIPSATIAVSTIVCIFGANTLNKHQQIALISAYSLIDNSFKEYRSELKALYGEEAHRNIVDSIAVEKSKDVYISSECLCSLCDLSVESHSDSSQLFFDEFANRYFDSTIVQVISAEYHFNRNYVLSGTACLNNLYEFLGLELTDYGAAVGWSTYQEIYWIDFNHRKVKTNTGLEYYILEMPFSPIADFEDY